MELVAIENSRVVYLTQMTRPSGQLYLPEAAAKIIERYGFVKYPTVEELLNSKQIFLMGKFQDSQIQEMGVYNDGLILSSSSNTDFLDALLDDLLGWARSELGVVETVAAKKPEKYYESVLVIKSEVDLMSIIGPATAIMRAFNKVWVSYSEVSFAPASFKIDCDATQFPDRRKPLHFGIERRNGTAFEDNFFFSTAPLGTDDHLALLTRLEELARG